MSRAPEYRQIAAALRRVLKGRKITYEALGEKLGVSSRTVKRIIQGDDYSVAKLAEVCGAVGIKFFDLMQLAHEESYETFELTEAQEEFLAASPRHFRCFRELVQGLTLEEVRAKHRLSAKATSDYARELESIGLLERLPHGAVRLTVSAKSHTFRSDGPLARRIASKDMERFFAKLEARDGKQRAFSTSSGTKISPKSLDAFRADAMALAQKYQLVAQREQSVLPPEELTTARWLIGSVHPFESWIDEQTL
jgi:transcriptional regulator with XRE-family HTH domain